jgi:hypothetical protein
MVGSVVATVIIGIALTLWLTSLFANTLLSKEGGAIDNDQTQALSAQLLEIEAEMRDFAANGRMVDGSDLSGAYKMATRKIQRMDSPD